MTDKDSELWVGKFKQSGDVFVYDPAINTPSSVTVKLFMHESFTMQEFDRASLRKKLSG